MIKVIAFDFFDVLHTDPQRAWLDEYGFRREGGFADVSDMLDEGNIEHEEYFRRYAELSGKQLDEIKDFYSSTSVNNDMVELVKSLHGNYRTALVSNAAPEEVRPRLKRHGLAEHLDVTIISGEVGTRKPFAPIFEILIDKVGAKPQEILFIDDNPHNCRGAAKLGIRTHQFKDHGSLIRGLMNMNLVDDQAIALC